MKRELSVEDIQLEQGIFSNLAKKRLDQCFVGNKEIFETANQLMWLLVSYGEYEKIERLAINRLEEIKKETATK